MATAKLYLDTRRYGQDTDKPARLKISVNHRQSTGYISLKIAILPSQWDEGKQKVKSHTHKGLLNAKIRKMLGDVTDILFRLSQSEPIDTWTNSELCTRIKAELGIKHKGRQLKIQNDNSNTICKFFEKYQQNKDIRERSKNKYGVCWRKIEDWLGKEIASKLEFKDITLGWIEEFDKHLSKTAPKPNGRRPSHAALKAVINYAMDHEVTDKNPYRRYKIKTNKTAKRNMSVDALRRIVFAQNLEPWMEKYRDFFVLSFMLRGLNTIDLCNMTKPVKGRVDWERTKTSQPMSLKIEREMQILIDRYAGNELMLEFAEGRNYRNFNNRLNPALHKISEHINKDIKNPEDKIPDFTMYWARHTWATIAAKLDISDGTISIGLAHSPKTVTDIYIERDPEKIDIANRRVLDYVLYNDDYRVPKRLPTPIAQPVLQ